MNNEEIKNYIKKKHKEKMSSYLKICSIGSLVSIIFWFIFIFIFGAFEVQTLSDRFIATFWMSIISLIFWCLVYCNGLFKYRHLNSNKFCVECARIEDKWRVDNWQDDLENASRHIKRGIKYYLKIQGNYHKVYQELYSRAVVGNYYTIVYSGSKKKSNSRIIGIFG